MRDEELEQLKNTVLYASIDLDSAKTALSKLSELRGLVSPTSETHSVLLGALKNMERTLLGEQSRYESAVLTLNRYKDATKELRKEVPEVWKLVTIKLPKNPDHDPHNKISGKCAVSDHCTDVTGEHHTLLVRDTGAVAKLRKTYHITRIEDV